jgi:energy-coupling factor transporter ATP-binding protein EcfA2
MSTPVLIIGKSGSGKSRSIVSLNPSETFVIASLAKDLPFRGWKKKYTPVTADGGNYVCSDDYEKIGKALAYVDSKRPEIKNVIIDDTQYLMINEFMRRHSIVGQGNAVFQLYNDIADHFWKLVFDARLYRKDLLIFLLAHSEINDAGESKMKTIGKLLDEKINAEGMFSIVLNTVVEDGKYFFETQNNGYNTTKSPEGMFTEKRIENDLAIVAAAINEYNKE